MEEHLLNGKRGKQLKLHFNLKQTREKEKLTQIMLVTTVNGQRIRVYTRLRIEPKYWDKDNARCRTGKPLSMREKMRLAQINRRIESLAISLNQADKRLAENGRFLSTGVVRQIVEEKQLKEESASNPIAYLYRQVEEYAKNVNRRGKRGATGTQRAYITALKRLESYCRQQEIRLTSFDDFDKKFFSGFANYLYTCTYGCRKVCRQYTQNTIINTLKVIKNLLHRAYDNEMTDNNYFRKVQTTLASDVSEQVYLQEREISRLARMPLEDRQELIVRDMFIIACYTALRISDIQRLNEAVIQNGFITLYQTKTKEQVQIPVLKEIAPLIEYYRSVGFPTFNPCQANLIIKDLARRCGIDEEVKHKECRGGEERISTQPKWKMVSFHTARRSCITNLYKRGYPVNYIMTLSGHKSVQAFQRYMRASRKEVMHNFVSLLKKDKAL